MSSIFTTPLKAIYCGARIYTVQLSVTTKCRDLGSSRERAERAWFSCRPTHLIQVMLA